MSKLGALIVVGLALAPSALYCAEQRPNQPRSERTHAERPSAPTPSTLAVTTATMAAPALGVTQSASFTRVAAPPGSASLYFDPSVPRPAVEKLREALAHVEATTRARLGLQSSAPDVFFYRSADQLRHAVRVTPRTVSYYDGAIHLAWDPKDDFLNSLRHEYTHHALFSHGLRRPVWFQEGVAMMLGGELQWLTWQPKRPLLPIQSMVQTFPQTADAESAEAFYGQAFAMTAFLNQLCKNRPDCRIRDLVKALESGAVRPENLFDWAVSERGADLVRTARLPLWDDYVANGLQLNRETAAALAARAASH